ncbi:LysR family transcriptional regulator [Leucobacter sp. GX24907]
MIDPRLRVLQLVAHHGTVTAAAHALNYSPSAVSHQLKQLSEELGVALLKQAGRGILLTDEAHRLLRHAEILFAQAEQAYADLGASAVGGRLTLCGFSTAAYLLPDVAVSLRAEFPELQIRLLETDPAHSLDLLLTGEADLALLTATADLPSLTDHRFDQRHHLDDPLDLLVAEGHPLARESRVSLTSAAEEPWITGHPDGPYHPLMISACLSAGFSPRIAHHADDWDLGLALIERNFGVSLWPRSKQIHPSRSVVRLPLRGKNRPTRQILSVTRAGGRGGPLVSAALTQIEARIAAEHRR